jgi:hypothetical protein
MSTITVKLLASRVAQLQHEAHIGIEAVTRLRRAGVPVIGALWPRGVEHGHLATRTDQGDLVLEWHFDPANGESVL